MTRRTTIPQLKKRKVSKGSEPIVAITAHDAPSARIADEAGVDVILVGDSLAMAVLGYDNTLTISVDQIAYHTAAVARTKPAALVAADMPWLSYHVSSEDTIRNGAKLIQAGAQCVKLEGGKKRHGMIEALIAAEIPVMGHIGLTPQSSNTMGGFVVQGKDSAAGEQLLADAESLQTAGCFSLVIEGVPTDLGELITNHLSIPTIGIGAGPGTDGQILVFNDLIGLENRFQPKFVRRYIDSYNQQLQALRQYGQDVKQGRFPSLEESYAARENTSEG
jgi:3-methyl-2-oxobutanoate hydroxymethyltransferase